MKYLLVYFLFTFAAFTLASIVFPIIELWWEGRNPKLKELRNRIKLYLDLYDGSGEPPYPFPIVEDRLMTSMEVHSKKIWDQELYKYRNRRVLNYELDYDYKQPVSIPTNPTQRTLGSILEDNLALHKSIEHYKRSRAYGDYLREHEPHKYAEWFLDHRNRID